MENTKPTILLVPDYLHWATARIAKEIVLRNKEFNFYILTKQQIEKRNSLITDVEPFVDAIHWLVPGGFILFSHLHSKRNIVSINHVVEWEPFIKCSNADFIVTISREWKDYLLTKGIDKDKIIEMKMTIDTNKFKPIPKKERLRKRYKIPVDAYVIGFFGKGSSNEFDRKGTNVFLNAIGILKDFCPNLYVFITGPEQDILISSLEFLNIKYRHKLFTSYADLSLAYNALDVYIITSNIEGGPLPLLESMSCSIPVLTTPVGIAKEIIVDGLNGILIPKGDPSAVVRNVMHLRNNLELASKIGANARRTIIENKNSNEYFKYTNLLFETLADNINKANQMISPKTRTLLINNSKKLMFQREKYEWISYRLTNDLTPKMIKLYGDYLSSLKQTMRVVLPKPIWSFLKRIKNLTIS